MEAYPAIHRMMHHYVDWRMQQLVELASELAYYDTMTRLMHLILRHFNENGKERRPCINIIKDLPHDELAHMIGTVRVVLNRLLGELRRDGIINTESGELRVRNQEKLLLKAERHAHLKNLKGITSEQLRK